MVEAELTSPLCNLEGPLQLSGIIEVFVVCNFNKTI